MAQADRASERLKQYLAQFAPQVRGRLLAELERLHLLGESIPRLDELLAVLRAEFPDGAERISDPVRYFFQPLEPVLVDRAPERANSGQIARGSLGPIWALLTTELLATMAREYVANASKVIASRPDVEKLAATFQKKALGYLDGTMRSAEGRDAVRAGLRKYTSSPAIFEDIVKMIAAFRASEALTGFGRAVPADIAKLEGRALRDVLKQLDALRAAQADAVPFALTIVASRLAMPWQLIHLATTAVESKAPAAIAATPYALAVSMVLDLIEEKSLLLAIALKNDRITIAKGILREIYTIENDIRAQIELGDSDWGKRLRDLMAAVTAALDAEVERSRTNCGNLSHVLTSDALRPAQSLTERLSLAMKKGRTMLSEILPA